MHIYSSKNMYNNFIAALFAIVKSRKTVYINLINIIFNERIKIQKNMHSYDYDYIYIKLENRLY